jgi:hypothetical protein
LDIIFKIAEYSKLDGAMFLSKALELLKKRLINPKSYQLTETDILKFMKFLSKNTSTDKLFTIWPGILFYIRECITPNANIHLIFELLIFLDSLFDQTTIQKRIDWRDSEEIYRKIMEELLKNTSKVFELKRLERMNTIKYVDSYIKFGMSFGKNTTKTEDQVINDVIVYFKNIFPNLPKRVGSDRITTIVQSFHQTLLLPCLKNKDPRKDSIVHDILKLLLEISIFTNDHKIWKRDVWLFFLDSNFFKTSKETLLTYTQILHALIITDTELFPDLTGRCI